MPPATNSCNAFSGYVALTLTRWQLSARHDSSTSTGGSSAAGLMLAIFFVTTPRHAIQ
ncbi:hypothetical protein PC128_g17163 [Phytophthora cactorum]|nr:hypothetical protein PC128_g17163 [Phytophthora cactorum]